MPLAEFESDVLHLGNIVPTVSDETIEKEIMLFSASPKFARDNGGYLTQTVLDFLEERMDLHDKNYVIDTKSVMLMPGMYPAIPGWHCDGVIRRTGLAQPDLEKMDPSVRHWTVLVSSRLGGVSQTEFVDQDLTVPYDPSMVWGSVDKHLNTIQFDTFKAQDGEVLQFTQSTLHRATPANFKGWRFFFRMSEYHMPPRNRIRNQVQVYAVPERGW